MDEYLALDILYINEYVHDELYQLVQQHLCSQLEIRLRELSNSAQYLRLLRKKEQEQVSLLMVAALHGYDDIVRVLLTHDNSIYQVELKGQMTIPNGICIDGATALYCACYLGHFTVAETLIELGQANINQDTCDYPYYPLFLHATINNRRDIVAFLLEHKYVDVNESKSYDSDECTALIWAATGGHTFLLEYFIANGADVNYSCRNQILTASTPIGCAMLAGHVDSVRLLYNAGADINIKTNNGDTILRTAVKRKYYSIIDFLLEQSINTIEDLELTACSLMKPTSSTVRMHEVFELLKFALHRRERSVIPKVSITPIAAYDYQQECQTIDELDSIKNDCDRIFLETLLIRERIFFEREDIAIIKALHYYGDMLVHKEEFDRCLNVWIHMFYLYQQMKISTILHRFIWLFCRMFTANQIIPVERFLQVCRLVFEPSQMEYKDFTIFNALCLVIVATKILEQEGISKADQTSIYYWVKDLCRHRLTSIDRKTFLHFCVNNQSNRILSFRQNDTSRYLEFPNEPALRLLLICGSRWLDLDAVESSDGNTPLHLICQGSEDLKIIQLLLNSGCHMDCVNKSGRIPLSYIQNSKAKTLFISKPIPSNLKCICARIIAKQRLNTDSFRTSLLNQFIVLHGCHPEEELCNRPPSIPILSHW